MELYQILFNSMLKQTSLRTALNRGIGDALRRGLRRRAMRLTEVRDGHHLFPVFGEHGLLLFYSEVQLGMELPWIYYIPKEGKPLWVSVHYASEGDPTTISALFGIRDEHGGWHDEIPVLDSMEDALRDMIRRNRN